MLLLAVWREPPPIEREYDSFMVKLHTLAPSTNGADDMHLCNKKSAFFVL